MPKNVMVAGLENRFVFYFVFLYDDDRAKMFLGMIFKTYELTWKPTNQEV